MHKAGFKATKHTIINIVNALILLDWNVKALNIFVLNDLDSKAFDLKLINIGKEPFLVLDFINGKNVSGQDAFNKLNREYLSQKPNYLTVRLHGLFVKTWNQK